MKIVILTAKCGLGTYIPAVYTYKYMRSHSVDTEMLVWEDFYETNNKERAMLFQKNPRIAEISYAYDVIKNKKHKRKKGKKYRQKR